METFDLFLGSDVGLWALHEVDPGLISHVFTLEERIFDEARALNIQAFMKNARDVDFSPAQIGFSVHYPRLIQPELIHAYRKLYNIHPGCLPWGRGYYPVFWALWEQTPCGVTIHEISPGLDEGPVVMQMRVEYFPYDTGGSLHRRVRDVEKSMFREFWGKLAAGEKIRSFVQQGEGTYHSKREFYELKRGETWKSLSGADLVRLIRALTFDGYPGLELTLDGYCFELHLESFEEAKHDDRN